MEPGEGAPAYDWTAVESSAEFQELTHERRRFAGTMLALGLGIALLYIVLCGVAPDFMATEVLGSMTLAVLGGVLLIVLTWGITYAYMRRAAAVWEPLEERVRQAAESARRPS